MSKSLARVRAAAEATGLPIEIVETAGSARSAAEAATALGVAVDQIVKSVIFRGTETGTPLLFLTAGSRRVDPGKAAALAGEPVAPADAAFVRAATGFVIGGVAPIGHLTPPRAWADPRLLDFGEIWAAAGTPRHVFAAAPAALLSAAGATLADFAT